MGLSIIHIFFRDGLIYFVIIFGTVSLLAPEPEFLLILTHTAMAAWSLLTYLCFTFSLVGSAY
jgi:hypothetical protein